jgi:hypothetical protein
MPQYHEVPAVETVGWMFGIVIEKFWFFRTPVK